MTSQQDARTEEGALRPCPNHIFYIPRVYRSANPDPWRTEWRERGRVVEKDHATWRCAIRHALQLMGVVPL